MESVTYVSPMLSLADICLSRRLGIRTHLYEHSEFENVLFTFLQAKCEFSQSLEWDKLIVNIFTSDYI